MNAIYVLLQNIVSNKASHWNTYVPCGMKKPKYNAMCVENEESIIALLTEEFDILPCSKIIPLYFFPEKPVAAG
jgi:hypothetical protein